MRIATCIACVYTFAAVGCASLIGIKDADLDTNCGDVGSPNCGGAAAKPATTATGAAIGNGGTASSMTNATSVGATSGGGAPLSSATTSVGTAMDAAIRAFVEIDCGKYQQCAPGYLALYYGTLAECIDREMLQYQWAFNLPGVAWKVTDFVACGRAWTQATCADYLNSTPQAACLVPGALSNGTACNRHDQCASLFCDSNGLSCGVCVDAPKQGDYCTNQSCGTGLHCAGDDTCQPPQGVGQSCSDNRPCQYALDCVQGTCRAPRATAGAACDASVDLYCDVANALTCATTTNTCVSVTKYAATGELCGVDTNGTTATLCAKGHCDGSTSLCVAYAADHASCDSDSGPYCEWPAFCSYGTCHLEKDLATCR